MTANTPSGARQWPALAIGDAVLDADGRAWRVLNVPDGSEHADGLFQAKDGNHGQRYGEHMRRPLMVWNAPPATDRSSETQ